MSQRTFNILALSGGGVRGIFQTAFLSALKRKQVIKEKFSDHFDLIVGTSTGSLIALALAYDIDIEEVHAQYGSLSATVFKKRYFSWLRGGGRFRQKDLRQALEQILGSQKLGAAKTGIVVTGTCLDRLSHKIFHHFPGINLPHNEDDAMLRVVDIALASCAAPTYFPALRPADHERTYVDGGLWANNPCLLGILIAKSYLGVSFDQMRVLSIGTGLQPHGLIPREFSTAQSLDTRLLVETVGLFSSAQARFSEHFSERLLRQDCFIHADIAMSRRIQLDDVTSAMEQLPGQAEAVAERLAVQVSKLIGVPAPKGESITGSLNQVPDWILAESGMTAFYPNRDYYRKYRQDASSISAYISLAKRSVSMISVNLMTGGDYEGVAKLFIKLLESDSNFKVEISLLDPRAKEVIETIAPNVDKSPRDLSEGIYRSLELMHTTRNSLSPIIAKRWYIGVHSSLPSASAIILDGALATGRIQIETKPYGKPLNKSYAMEFVPRSSDSIFQVLYESYNQLIHEGSRYSGSRQFVLNSYSTT